MLEDMHQHYLDGQLPETRSTADVPSYIDIFNLFKVKIINFNEIPKLSEHLNGQRLIKNYTIVLVISKKFHEISVADNLWYFVYYMYIK